MPDLTRIIDALVALAATIPGEPNITIGSSLAFNFESSDDHTRAFAAAFGVEMTWTGNENGRWLSGSVRHGELFIFIYGPHHPIVAVEEPDPAAVTAALALADEAVSP